MAARNCDQEASCEAEFTDRGVHSPALGCRHYLYGMGVCDALADDEAACVDQVAPVNYPLPVAATWRQAGVSPSHRYVALAGREEEGGALAVLDQSVAPTAGMDGGLLGAVRTPPPQGQYRAVYLRGESAVFSADETTLVAMVSNTSNGNRPDALLVWDLETDDARLILPELPTIGQVAGMALSPGGRVLALAFQLTGTTRYEVRLIDVESEELIVTLLNNDQGGAMGSANGGNPMLAFSPRGDLLAVGWEGNGPSNRLIEVWALSGYSKRYEFTSVQSRFRSLAFSPDGSTLLTGEFIQANFTTGLSVWDMDTGDRIRTLTAEVPSGGELYGVSPDGRFAWVLGQESGGSRPTEIQFFGP